MEGRISDSTGAPLPGVTIEARNTEATFLSVSNSEGWYEIDLPQGVYDLSYRLLSFATVMKQDVEARREKHFRLDVTLYLSSAAEVVVTARRTFRNLVELTEPVNDLIGLADAASAGVVTAQEIERRHFQRPGEILETVPGFIVSQHSGEGKANQYYLRGFNLDHGTDVSLTVAGVPVNMPTHGHGQGYADANFLIPELIGAVQYRKGPYYAEEGDFSSAGAVNINYLNLLDQPMAVVEGGSFDFARAFFAHSLDVAGGHLLYAVEGAQNDGPWERPDRFRKQNLLLRYARGDQRGGWSVTAMGYEARWRATDQIPARAVQEGVVSRFGTIDPTDGGETHRFSLSGEWQRNRTSSRTHAALYGIDYGLDLFSNFTYFLDDPINGDQFEQVDDRQVWGGSASHRWMADWGSIDVENMAGVELRRDDIAHVGLYRTRERRRLSTVRSDALTQTSGALFAQSSVQWSSKVRTVAGLRGDHYDFGTHSATLASPKLTLIAGPWRNTELYLNGGFGFHSNDARTGADPLARTKGAEIGLRSLPHPRVHLSGSLWALDIASELLFIGDAGTTEASRPSRRTGVELTSFLNLGRHLALDGEYAYSRARFRDADPAGDRVPGAIEGVASAAVMLKEWRGLSGEIRYRYFGARPLIEDNSIRSKPSNLVSIRLARAIAPRWSLGVDVFNLLNAEVSDIDYFYASRLPGEAAAGVEDLHFHPVETRSFRVGLTGRF